MELTVEFRKRTYSFFLHSIVDKITVQWYPSRFKLHIIKICYCANRRGTSSSCYVHIHPSWRRRLHCEFCECGGNHVHAKFTLLRGLRGVNVEPTFTPAFALCELPVNSPWTLCRVYRKPTPTRERRELWTSLHTRVHGLSRAFTAWMWSRHKIERQNRHMYVFFQQGSSHGP